MELKYLDCFHLVILFILSAVLYIVFNYKIRRKFLYKVNCWFCNGNTKVPYEERNSFICPSCSQYNGFNKDGGYNKQILEQHDEMLNPQPVTSSQDKAVASNGLCKFCNNNQQLKIFQLASFVPLNEDNYDIEIEHFQKQLEKAYKLCPKCDKVLKKTISKQNKWMMGLKLSFIKKKGLIYKNIAETINQVKLKRRLNWGWFLLQCVFACFYTAVLLAFLAKYTRINFKEFIPQYFYPYLILGRSYAQDIYTYLTTYTVFSRTVDVLQEKLGGDRLYQIFIVLGILFHLTLFYTNKKKTTKQSKSVKSPIKENTSKSYVDGDVSFSTTLNAPANSTDISTDTIESDYETFNSTMTKRKKKTKKSQSTKVFGEFSLNKSKSPTSFQQLNESFTSTSTNKQYQSFSFNPFYNKSSQSINQSINPINQTINPITQTINPLNQSINPINGWLNPLVPLQSKTFDLSLSLSNLKLSPKQTKPILSPSKFRNPWTGNFWEDKTEICSRSSSQSSGFISNFQENSSVPNSQCNSFCGEFERNSILSEPVFHAPKSFSHAKSMNTSYIEPLDKTLHGKRSLFVGGNAMVSDYSLPKHSLFMNNIVEANTLPSNSFGKAACGSFTQPKQKLFSIKGHFDNKEFSENNSFCSGFQKPTCW